MSKGITVDGPDNSYVEVGEKYMLFYGSDGALNSGVPSGDDDSILANGVIDLTHANADTIDNLVGLDDSGWSGWSLAALGGAAR